MFNQFRRVRSLLPNATGTPTKGRGRPEEQPEKASRYVEAKDEQPDKLFPRGAIHNESEGLYRGVESQ